MCRASLGGANLGHPTAEPVRALGEYESTKERKHDGGSFVLSPSRAFVVLWTCETTMITMDRTVSSALLNLHSRPARLSVDPGR